MSKNKHSNLFDVKPNKEQEDWLDGYDNDDKAVLLDVSNEESSDISGNLDDEKLLKHKGKLKLKGDIHLEGKEYSGKSVKRKEAFPDASESESGKLDLPDDQSQSVTESKEEENEITESEDEENIYEEYNKLYEDDPLGTQRIKKKAEENKEKGKEVIRQKLKWNKWLDLRIKIQGIVEMANQMPYGIFAEKIYNKYPNMKNKRNEIEKMCKRETINLMHIEKCLILNNPKMNKNSNKEKKVHLDDTDDTEDMWSMIEDQYKYMSRHRDEALNKYYTEAMLISGNVKSIKDNTSIKGISTQVKEIMIMSKRLIKKSQMPIDKQLKILGIPDVYFNKLNEENLIDNKKRKEIERNPEIYADNEFYHSLLKNITDSNLLNFSYEMNKSKRRRQEMHQKHRNRIKYNVHEKLVNFCKPVEREDHPLREHIINNLFGCNQIKKT